MPRKSLAEFELLVMLAISRLGPEAYGGSVLREIAERTGRDVSIGALYATLARLEGKGLLVLNEADPSPGQRGRPRKYAELTEAGLDATRTTAHMFSQMLDGLTLPEGSGS